MKTIALIDGNNLAHRFYWGFQRNKRKNEISLYSGNKETTIIYGFLREIILIEKRYPNSEKIIVWDGGSIRRKSEANLAINNGLIKTGYKSTRKKMNEDDLESLNTQISHLQSDILPNLGIMQIQIQGFEADDIIYSYTLKYKDDKCICITSDRDYFQALTDNVIVVDLINDRVWDKNKFLKEYGFPCEHYVDFGALMGDTSDNIPGVPKCGKVNSIKLIKEYGTIENLLKGLAIKENKSKVEESVLNNTELLRLSYSLKKMDVINVPDIIIEKKKIGDVKKLIIEWGCISILKDAIKLC